MKWFRLYDDLLDDPKAQQLSPVLFKHWINLLCLASKSDPRGTLPGVSDVAFRLRVTTQKTRSILKELTAIGLVDAEGETFRMHNWTARQPNSDNVTDRVRKHRAAVASNDDETLQKRSRNALDTDTDTETSSSPDGELGAAAPADQSGPSEIKSADPPDPSPDEPEKPWVPHGPDQQLVKWWSEFTGYPVPKMFGTAVGAAANLRKAGLKPEEAEDLYRFCDGIFPGDAVVTLQKMAGRYDEWQASKLPKRSPAPPAPNQPPRRAMAQSRDEIEQRAREFMGGSRGSA